MTAPSSECRAFLRVVESFVDGELAPAAIVEGERHVSGCAHCRERVALGRAMKASVRDLAKAPLGDAAKSRLRASLEAELARTPAPARSVPLTRVAVGTFFAAGFAAAAAWFLAPRLGAPGAAEARAANDVLGELVAEHVRPLPMDGTDVQTVRSLERYVGVPIRPHFPQSRAKLVGARVLPFQQERAAIVQYELEREGAAQVGPARRVSVLVFDPRRIRLNPQVGTFAEPVGGHPVRVMRTQGLPVAYVEDDGIGYAISGDVDEQQAVELVRYVASP